MVEYLLLEIFVSNMPVLKDITPFLIAEKSITIAFLVNQSHDNCMQIDVITEAQENLGFTVRLPVESMFFGHDSKNLRLFTFLI